MIFSVLCGLCCCRLPSDKKEYRETTKKHKKNLRLQVHEIQRFAKVLKNSFSLSLNTRRFIQFDSIQFRQ